MESAPNKAGIQTEEVSFEADLFGKPVKVECRLPVGEHYGAELKRLSRKVLRSEGYGKPEWNDSFGTVIKWKTRRFEMGPFSYHVREVHDDTKIPQESLIQLQVITVLPSEDIGGESFSPMQYFIYTPASERVQVFKFDQVPEGIDGPDLQEAADLEVLAGQDQVSLKDRAFFYLTLVQLAGEKQQNG